jgi:flagellar biosynthesis GTPase FlhF
VSKRVANERNANKRNANERNVNERDVNEWNNTEELNEKDDELNEKKINWLNDDKKLKEKKTSKEKDATERVVEKLKRWDAKKEWNTRREEMRFMKWWNVSVLNNEFESELKREKDRMKALIFKRLIMRIKLQIQCECLSNYDQWNIDIFDVKRK